ncbi:hypothetical protein T439DRAFT_355616 [Meredithblackwellia eburnea MCA 4105]
MATSQRCSAQGGAGFVACVTSHHPIPRPSSQRFHSTSSDFIHCTVIIAIMSSEKSPYLPIAQAFQRLEASVQTLSALHIKLGKQDEQVRLTAQSMSKALGEEPVEEPSTAGP